MKNRKSQVISYAQYFATIPSKPFGGNCYFNAGSTRAHIEIVCTGWKSALMLVYRVLQDKKIVKISTKSKFEILKQSTTNQPYRVQICDIKFACTMSKFQFYPVYIVSQINKAHFSKRPTEAHFRDFL